MLFYIFPFVSLSASLLGAATAGGGGSDAGGGGKTLEAPRFPGTAGNIVVDALAGVLCCFAPPVVVRKADNGRVEDDGIVVVVMVGIGVVVVAAGSVIVNSK